MEGCGGTSSGVLQPGCRNLIYILIGSEDFSGFPGILEKIGLFENLRKDLTMDVTCKQILEALVDGFKGEGAGEWKAVMQFSFSGDKGGDFYLTIEDKQCALKEGASESPTATVKSSDQVWIDITLGKTNPMTAFMTGKVSVKGNMGDVMKLQNRNIFDPKKP